MVRAQACTNRLCATPFRILLPVFLMVAAYAATAQPRGTNEALAAIMREHRATALKSTAASSRPMFQVIAAKLRLGVDTARAWRQLDTLMSNPTGDMFWMYPAVGFYLYCKDILNDAWRQRFRRAMRTYTPYRGDTENHFLMYYSTLLLFSQEWPDLQRGDWFNGKSSRENYAEAKDYLDTWITETVTAGTTEWDSPRYLYFYITPLLTLYDFTADTLLRKRVGMMLEYQLADYAAEYLQGSYCGAHSRDGDNSVIDPRNSEARSYGEFYFEDSLAFVLPDLAYAAMSHFECPAIIRDIARDREQPFEHTEVKRSRAKIRFAPERYTPVYKYDYIARDYGIGSIQGGLQQPIQQHSWGVNFASHRANATILGLHPQMSGIELGMFFPEEPEIMVSAVASTKGSYVNEDKWIGGSQYERIVQDRNVLAALYRIDSAASCDHADIFFPKTLDTLERQSSGWIVARMENAFVAVYPLNQKYAWTEEKVNWRLRMPLARGETGGYIVECASAADISYNDFAAHYRTTGLAPELSGDLFSLNWAALDGRHLALRATGDSAPILTRDGRAVVHDTTDLFNGPYLTSKPGSGVLRMQCHGAVRVLDFARGEVRDRP